MTNKNNTGTGQKLKIITWATLLLPVLFIAAFAYKKKDELLLLGIAFYYIGVVLVVLKQKIFYCIPVFLCVGFWFIKGFELESLVTIFFVCLTAGFFLYQLSISLKKFIKDGMPEKQAWDEFDSKLEEVNNRVEQYKKDHPGKKITPEIIDAIKTEVFFSKNYH